MEITLKWLLKEQRQNLHKLCSRYSIDVLKFNKKTENDKAKIISLPVFFFIDHSISFKTTPDIQLTFTTFSLWGWSLHCHFQMFHSL